MKLDLKMGTREFRRYTKTKIDAIALDRLEGVCVKHGRVRATEHKGVWADGVIYGNDTGTRKMELTLKARKGIW